MFSLRCDPRTWQRSVSHQRRLRQIPGNFARFGDLKRFRYAINDFCPPKSGKSPVDSASSQPYLLPRRSFLSQFPKRIQWRSHTSHNEEKTESENPRKKKPRNHQSSVHGDITRFNSENPRSETPENCRNSAYRVMTSSDSENPRTCKLSKFCLRSYDKIELREPVEGES